MIKANLIMNLALKDKIINVDEEPVTSKTKVPSIKIKSTETREHISAVVELRFLVIWYPIFYRFILDIIL